MNIRNKAVHNLFIAVLLFLLFHSYTFAELKGGCVKVNITPPVGCWLTGYGGRDRGSDNVYDELYVKSLVLCNGETSIALVSADLLWIPLDITNEIRKIAHEKTGIPENNILICATHTHFGPKIFENDIIGKETPENKVDDNYVKTLINKIAGAIYIAHNNMKAVKIGHSRGELPEIIFNRRTKTKDGAYKGKSRVSHETAMTRKIIKNSDGTTKISFDFPDNEPELEFGPVDPDLCVLKVEDTNGKTIGTVVNYACHAVSGSIYSDWFYSISGDFPAYTANVIESIEGGICLFTSGTAGDMVPLERGKEPRFETGKAIGGSVLRHLQFLPTTGNIDIKVIRRNIKLPLKEDPSTIIRIERPAEYLHTEIQAIKIGDNYLLGLPGEVLAEIGLEIKKNAHIENLFIITLSNDTKGYICHSKAYEEGGYEASNGTNYAKGSGETIIKESLLILDKLQHIE